MTDRQPLSSLRNVMVF